MHTPSIGEPSDESGGRSPDAAPPGDLAPEEMLAEAGHSTQDSEFFNPVPEGYRTGHHKYVAVLGTVMSGLG